MPTRDNMVMIKRDQPKKVSLPRGRISLAPYKHITRYHLPENMKMRQRYRQRDDPLNRRQQRRQGGWSLGSIFKFANNC